MGHTTIVMKYGVKAPTENAELIRKQLLDGHKLKNRHVEIEIERRNAHRAALAAYSDMKEIEIAIAKADEEVSALLTKLRVERANRRDKKDPKELVEAFKKAKAAKAELLRRWRERKAELRKDPSVRKLMDAANEKASADRKAARAEFSERGKRMRHGTYTMIESAAEQASKSPLYDGLEPNNPKFRRWRGEGRIGVQILGGATFEELKDHPFLRILPVRRDSAVTEAQIAMCKACERPRQETCPPRVNRNNGCMRHCPVVQNSKRSTEQLRELWLRIGTGPNREPIWGVWPMWMHRPLPEGALVDGSIKHPLVMFAAVSVIKVGPQEHWYCELRVRLFKPLREPTSDEPVAVEIGWRKFGDRIRVASWIDTKGNTGELLLPEWEIGGIRRADSLRSARDKSFDAIRARLVSWLEIIEIPKWMREAVRKRDWLPVPSKAQTIAWLSEWRSQARLAKLTKIWSSNRFEGDQEIYGALEAWRADDLHLWRWESSARFNAINRRKWVYQNFAAQLHKNHGLLILEDLDLRPLIRRPAPESKEQVNPIARSNRQLAAPGELRACLINRFGPVWTRLVPSPDMTRKCNVCGVIESFNSAEEIRHTCVNGHEWDQDFNSRANLLTTWCEHPDKCKTMVKAPSPEDKEGKQEEGRRAKARRLAKERRDRLGLVPVSVPTDQTSPSPAKTPKKRAS